eukprot:scaffold18584_cov33-Phaeocystis_antarctica.AAC.1
MNKSATSSLLGASATRLTRFADHARTRTMRAQQSVTMIATMGLSQAARGGANGARPRTRQKVGLGPRRANSPMRGRAPFALP